MHTRMYTHMHTHKNTYVFKCARQIDKQCFNIIEHLVQHKNKIALNILQVYIMEVAGLK